MSAISRRHDCGEFLSPSYEAIRNASELSDSVVYHLSIDTSGVYAIKAPCMNFHRLARIGFGTDVVKLLLKFWCILGQHGFLDTRERFFKTERKDISSELVHLLFLDITRFVFRVTNDIADGRLSLYTGTTSRARIATRRCLSYHIALWKAGIISDFFIVFLDILCDITREHLESKILECTRWSLGEIEKARILFVWSKGENIWMAEFR